MKHLKKFETIDDALYDILAAEDEDEKKIQLNSLLAKIEDEESEEGKSWSDKERSQLNQLVKKLEPELSKKPDSVSTETKEANALLSVKNNAKTTIKRIESAMSDDRYKPKNPSKVEIIKWKLKNLMAASKEKDYKKIEDCIKAVEKEFSEAKYAFSTNEELNLKNSLMAGAMALGSMGFGSNKAISQQSISTDVLDKAPIEQVMINKKDFKQNLRKYNQVEQDINQDVLRKLWKEKKYSEIRKLMLDSKMIVEYESKFYDANCRLIFPDEADYSDIEGDRGYLKRSLTEQEVSVSNVTFQENIVNINSKSISYTASLGYSTPNEGPFKGKSSFIIIINSQSNDDAESGIFFYSPMCKSIIFTDSNGDVYETDPDTVTSIVQKLFKDDLKNFIKTINSNKLETKYTYEARIMKFDQFINESSHQSLISSIKSGQIKINKTSDTKNDQVYFVSIIRRTKSERLKSILTSLNKSIFNR